MSNEYEERLWFSDWPTKNGFYWLRGWRHYGDLPVSVDGDSFWMMFNLAKNHRTDLDDSEDVQFLGPITPYSGITAATRMRNKCIEKVKERLAVLEKQTAELKGDPLAHAGCSGRDSAIRDILRDLQSLSLDEVERGIDQDG